MQLAADTKTCSRCKAEKSLDAFSTNRAMNDGKNIYCRACLSAADKKRRSQLSLAPRESVSEKRCGRCREVKPASDYARNRASTHGLQSSCKDCVRRVAEERIRSGATPPAEQVCTACRKSLPASRFHRNSHSSSLLHPSCKDCNRRKVRAAKYGIGEDWLSRIDATNNCEICQAEIAGPKKHLDHDHATGAPRGVLCTKCNAMLGFARDSQKILLSACQYLSRFHFTAGVKSRAS
jgi:hypothetical protein